MQHTTMVMMVTAEAQFLKEAYAEQHSVFVDETSREASMTAIIANSAMGDSSINYGGMAAAAGAALSPVPGSGGGGGDAVHQQ